MWWSTLEKIVGLMEILLSALIALFLCELILGALRMQPAWKFGLPLYSTTRKLQGAEVRPLPAISEIEASGAVSVGIGPEFRFRRFTDESIAFRESLNRNFPGFVYLPLMRGRLEINAYTNELVVRGYSYFWPYLAAALALYAHWQTHADLSPETPVAEVAGFVMLFAITWTIQALRFNALANRVAEIFSQGSNTNSR